ncbi:hypothetical protein DESC_930003 [Desulfosarcina cetonica]|nr:hypothetical protein DESC_930003 [Desulfosarcina cetonica]
MTLFTDRRLTPIPPSIGVGMRIKNNPCRVRDWKVNFDPTLTKREPELVFGEQVLLVQKSLKRP